MEEVCYHHLFPPTHIEYWFCQSSMNKNTFVGIRESSGEDGAHHRSIKSESDFTLLFHTSTWPKTSMLKKDLLRPPFLLWRKVRAEGMSDFFSCGGHCPWGQHKIIMGWAWLKDWKRLGAQSQFILHQRSWIVLTIDWTLSCNQPRLSSRQVAANLPLLAMGTPPPISSSYSLPWSMKTILYRQLASTHRKSAQLCSLGKARNVSKSNKSKKWQKFVKHFAVP